MFLFIELQVQVFLVAGGYNSNSYYYYDSDSDLSKKDRSHYYYTYDYYSTNDYSNSGFLSSTEIYIPGWDSWKYADPLPKPVAAAAHVSHVSHNNNIYLLGDILGYSRRLSFIISQETTQATRPATLSTSGRERRRSGNYNLGLSWRM